jgi:hypothetical protein
MTKYAYGSICVDCKHKRENHMIDSHTGRTDCDFPDCNCHEFRDI